MTLSMLGMRIQPEFFNHSAIVDNFRILIFRQKVADKSRILQVIVHRCWKFDGNEVFEKKLMKSFGIEAHKSFNIDLVPCYTDRSNRGCK